MRTIGLLTALAMAAAARAMPMTSERDHATVVQPQVLADSPSVAPSTAQPCRRQVDRFGNIRVICPNRRLARAAWLSRRRSYRNNFAVFYRDGGRLKVWGQWSPRRR